MHGHAVVIGGSVAGLMAAFGAADSFERVTVLERDDLIDGPEPRKGAPQGRQPHACLPIGMELISEFIPDLRDQLLSADCTLLDDVLDLPYLSAEGWRMRMRSGVEMIGFRRPLFEWVIRRNLLKLPNVSVKQGVASGLVSVAGTVTGVRLQGVGELPADLVIDATGRGSQAPRWVEELGYEAPAERHVRAFMGYAAQQVRVPEGLIPEGAKGIAAMPWPGQHRGGILIPADNGVHMLTAVGMMKDYPPSDPEALLDFLDDAPTPILGELARQCEPVSDIATYRVPGNQFRLWHRMEARPDNFLVTGDAVASFNPIYAQGMSQAAHGGVALRAALRNESNDPRSLADRFQEAHARFTEVAFSMSGLADAFYDDAEIEGMEKPDVAEMEYFTRLEQLATEDPDVLMALVVATYSMKPELLEDDELQRKAQSWSEAGRTVVNNDPGRMPAVTERSGG